MSKPYDNPSELIDAIFTGLLGRGADEAGRKFYSDRLASDPHQLSIILSEIKNSAEFRGSQSRRLDPVFACSEAEAVNVFQQFRRYTGPGRDGFITNFLGALTSCRHGKVGQLSGVVEGLPIPRNFHAETLEWVAVMRAVVEAKKTFTMIELGAGWAPWCSIGYIASEMKGLQPAVMAVEGDLGHIEFINESFSLNGQDPSRCQIVHGVVGAEDGRAAFPQLKKASHGYGGAARFGDESNSYFDSFMDGERENIADVQELDCFSLKTLIGKMGGACDLVHCDIQGAEREVIPASIDALTESVKRVMIGTHSFDIDRQLISLFPQHGWICEGAEATRMTTAGGALCIMADGTQVWRNGRLHG